MRWGLLAACVGALSTWAGDGGTASKACYRGGCSQELCTEKPGATSACTWEPKFACYQKAECARQKDGRCGFTPTKQLERCLAEAAKEPAQDVQ